jgi:hypothetical protein
MVRVGMCQMSLEVFGDEPWRRSAVVSDARTTSWDLARGVSYWFTGIERPYAISMCAKHVRRPAFRTRHVELKDHALGIFIS